MRLAFATALLLSACSSAGPATRAEIVEVTASPSRTLTVTVRLLDAEGGSASVAGTTLEVDVLEREPGAPAGHGLVFCQHREAVDSGDLGPRGVRVYLAPGGFGCRSATPGRVADVRVTVTSPAGRAEPVSVEAPPELQPAPGAVAEVSTPPEPEPEVAPVAPAPEAPAVIAGVVAAPHPIALEGVTGTLDRDPADPSATIVRTASCEVRIAEVHAMPGDVVDGARTITMLEGIGATFTTRETAPDRWALAYRIGERYSVQHGRIVEGRPYVCRGDYPSAEAQACAMEACATMRATGGAAAPTPSGIVVGSCVHEERCAQVHADGPTMTTEAVLQVATTCGMVSAPVREGACPATLQGFAIEGRCATAQGVEWVYYRDPEGARAECATLGGTYSAAH